VYGINLTN